MKGIARLLSLFILYSVIRGRGEERERRGAYKSVQVARRDWRKRGC